MRSEHTEVKGRARRSARAANTKAPGETRPGLNSRRHARSDAPWQPCLFTILRRASRCLALLVSLSVAALQAQPANDFFANATVLMGESGFITQSTAAATLELGEPAHGGDPGGASVWFVWEAPASGAAEFQLHLSDFDTTIGAYTGASLDSLEPVAENDDAFNYYPLISRWLLREDQSHIRFPAQAGVRYHIAVDGAGGSTGTLSLHWALHSTPTNDSFSGARPLTGAEGFLTTHNVGATKEPGEPNHATNAGSASIWFRWTAPVSGNARIHTLNSLNDALTPLDTLLAVYTGTSMGALTQVAANDNNGTSLRSLVQFAATAGTTYHIAVDTKVGGTNQGRIVLTWANGVPTNNNLASATRLSGVCGLIQGHNTFATKESNEPAIAENLGGASIWYVWTAPADGDVLFTTQGSPFLDTLLAVYTGTTINSPLTRRRQRRHLGRVPRPTELQPGRVHRQRWHDLPNRRRWFPLGHDTRDGRGTSSMGLRVGRQR